MNETARPKVAFLDTNALHYMYLYLQLAENRSLYPFSPNDDAVVEAREHLDRAYEGNLRTDLKKGLAAVEFLAHPDIRVEYSSISELELMNGRARGKAIENAAKEGVPDRIWNRLDGYEIRARLTTADLANIRTRVEGLGPILNKAGILATVSDVYRTRDVLDLAKGIIGLVYMGFVDGVIYSSALIAGVDYMITEDTFFRKDHQPHPKWPRALRPSQATDKDSRWADNSRRRCRRHPAGSEKGVDQIDSEVSVSPNPGCSGLR